MIETKIALILCAAPLFYCLVRHVFRSDFSSIERILISYWMGRIARFLSLK